MYLFALSLIISIISTQIIPEEQNNYFLIFIFSYILLSSIRDLYKIKKHSFIIFLILCECFAYVFFNTSLFYLASFFVFISFLFIIFNAYKFFKNKLKEEQKENFYKNNKESENTEQNIHNILIKYLRENDLNSFHKYINENISVNDKRDLNKNLLSKAYTEDVEVFEKVLNYVQQNGQSFSSIEDISILIINCIINKNYKLIYYIIGRYKHLKYTYNKADLFAFVANYYSEDHEDVYNKEDREILLYLYKDLNIIKKENKFFEKNSSREINIVDENILDLIKLAKNINNF